MARKRMIDPNIWTDSKIVHLTNEAFIVFFGLISNADDEGIFETDAGSLFFRLARKDLSPDIIGNAIEEIIKLGLIVPYGEYAFFPTWYKHQTLNRPSKTKLRRPPTSMVKQHPTYVEGWISSFTYYKKTPDGEREAVIAEYPFNGDSMQFIEDTVNTHGAVTESSSLIEVKGSEVNRKEGKGKEVNSEAVVWASESEICSGAWNSFQKYYGSLLPHPHKEIDSMNQLIGMAGQRGDVRTIVLAMMKKLKELKDEDTTKKGFWRGQPYLPSTLVSLWAQVWEAAKIEHQDNADLEELFPDD